MHHAHLLMLAIGATMTFSAAAQDAAAPPPIRVMLRARSGGADRLTPLRYIGGFETKTLLYETLVRRGQDGRIVPGLASRWWIDDDGRTCHFELREGALFHDGKPVTASAVCVHFQRWIGLPEHDWLPVNRYLRGVEVESERVFAVKLEQPYSLLADLCAVNPCAIVGPGARDWEGEFQRPMGTGPFRFLGSFDDCKRWRIARTEPGGPVVDVTFAPRGRDTTPIDALQRGEIDAFVGGWDEDLPGERLDELARDPRFVVQTAPGSSVAYVSFRLSEGPTADVAIRRRIAAAIDRQALIDAVEGARADASTTWAAPSVAFWPRSNTKAGAPRPAEAAAGATPIVLRLAAGRGTGRAARIAEAVKGQLERAGFQVELLARPAARVDSEGEKRPQPGAGGTEGTVRPLDDESGEVRAARNRAVREAAEAADLRIEITHGVPYCPHESLVARFGPVRAKNHDEPRPRTGVDPRLQALVAAAMSTPDEAACIPIYAEIQALMDAEALIVPLYSPRRVALRTAGVDGISLGIDVYRVDLTGLRRVQANTEHR
ncbi:MAG TPA: ABC transporter substrate-binding protein [Planctomycetota bacterium]